MDQGCYKGSYRGPKVLQRRLQGPQGVREGITGAPNAESRGTHWITRGSSALSSVFPALLSALLQS